MTEHSVEREREDFLAAVDRLADRIDGGRRRPAALLCVGEWTRAGRYEVRLEPERPC